MSLDKKLLEVGKLISTHGIKGEFKFWLNNEFYLVDDLNNKQIFLKDNQNNFDVYTIERFYQQKQKMILKLSGIDDINTAQKFKNHIVLFKIEDNLVEQEVNLVNYQVSNNNHIVGIVKEVMFNGAQDLLKVQENQTTQYWIPYVDEFIINCDDDTKIIYVKNIERLK
ncbi:ribosome maturation factor RimM [Spiroplasma culicicola]|uniref:Ribosome maturation factor RimM n=1 Tax=Spiroplasma culicicola AES-1 TaxID=1276246 RepID=W6A6V6_9MOLU|nr:ribosome maturation factor RimM [Spiroplasma culicicola]AHI52696.1 16S rRNA processing protein rimM [Spiroplasma culicicola AES-1]